MSSTVAVTGAAGFIGAAVCRRLVAEGHEVIGIDVDASAAVRVTETGAQYRRADVSDRGAVRGALQGAELVIHTAALLTSAGGMADYVRVNVGGTENVCIAAADAGVSRVVHLSSVAAWGYDFRTDITEDQPLATHSSHPYIATKAASELVARKHGATIVKPGDVYGPYSQPWAVIPFELIKSGRVALPMKGRGILTLVYVDDLVDCVYRALTLPAGDGGVFTAWDGNPVTAKEFFDHYARMLGKSGVRTAPTALLRPLMRLTPGVDPADLIFLMRRAVYPNARARQVLGWEPQVTLGDGMARTETWLRERGQTPPRVPHGGLTPP
jgi:nucleoside-diphosphate-sugar epimerase